MERVTVIGAGLAGCEATWQLIKRNIPVRLVEMRPKVQPFIRIVLQNLYVQIHFVQMR